MRREARCPGAAGFRRMGLPWSTARGREPGREHRPWTPTTSLSYGSRRWLDRGPRPRLDRGPRRRPGLGHVRWSRLRRRGTRWHGSPAVLEPGTPDRACVGRHIPWGSGSSTCHSSSRTSWRHPSRVQTAWHPRRRTRSNQAWPCWAGRPWGRATDRPVEHPPHHGAGSCGGGRVERDRDRRLPNPSRPASPWRLPRPSRRVVPHHCWVALTHPAAPPALGRRRPAVSHHFGPGRPPTAAPASTTFAADSSTYRPRR